MGPAADGAALCLQFRAYWLQEGMILQRQEVTQVVAFARENDRAGGAFVDAIGAQRGAIAGRWRAGRWARGRNAIAGDVSRLAPAVAVHRRATGGAAAAHSAAIPAVRAGAAERLLADGWPLGHAHGSGRPSLDGKRCEERLIREAQCRHSLRRARSRHGRIQNEGESCQGQGKPKNHSLHAISFLERRLFRWFRALTNIIDLS